MKKRILCFLPARLTLLALAVCAAASEPQLYNITDTAGLLTDEQDLQLEELAAETTAKLSEVRHPAAAMPSPAAVQADAERSEPRTTG